MRNQPNAAVRVAAVLLAFLAMTAGSSFAQSEGHGDRGIDIVPIARRLFNEGVDAAQRRDWPTALDRFSRSYEISPRPLTLFNLAGAQTVSGKVVRASESYRRFLRETADGLYPEHREEARRAVAALEKRIAYLKIRVAGLASADELIIDDVEFPRAALGEPVPLDPGQHTFLVRRRGSTVGKRDLLLSEGASEEIWLQVPIAAKPADTSPDVLLGNRPAPEPPREPGRPWYRSGWLWVGVGVVATSAIAGGTYLYLNSRPYDGNAGSIDVSGQGSRPQ